jgi:glutathione-independent formaldehyde dehydrogenase
VCLNVNPERAGGAYGYVDMGGRIGGQAEYVMVPYADFNLLRFPDKDRAMEKIRDVTCLTDILPTGYHGCISAGVTTGSTVLIAGAGPVGLAAAASALLLGAAVAVVMDFNKERLAQARSFGCETFNLAEGGTVADHIEQILGVREVDCAVDCVGFEAKGHGGADQPAVVLMKYNRALMMAVLHDRIRIAKAVNVRVIALDQAPQGYAEFDRGVAEKFVIDPHGLLGAKSG